MTLSYSEDTAARTAETIRVQAATGDPDTTHLYRVLIVDSQLPEVLWCQRLDSRPVVALALEECGVRFRQVANDGFDHGVRSIRWGRSGPFRR